jgi:phosphoribosyl 1,2-cyclic phosphodiesterase
VIEIDFYGVRGSTPCSGPATSNTGGNTSCVAVSVDGEDVIILDLGTGARYLGAKMCATEVLPVKCTALVSHLHWDHVQGIPFFGPLLNPDSELHIVGPKQIENTLEEAIHRFISPPLFPVEMAEIPAKLSFHEASEGAMPIGSAAVSIAPLTHVGATNCYRIDGPSSGSVAYLSDHQEPPDGVVPRDIAAFCSEVDVLIHDAQYDAQELLLRSDWGHSTAEFAVNVALESNAKRLVLFHHDPSHDDEWVANATAKAQAQAGSRLEVIAAVEGLRLTSGI